MKKSLFTLILLIGFIINSQAQSGTIYYWDGNTLKFDRITDFQHSQTSLCTSHTCFEVNYQGTKRIINLSQIDYFSIKEVGKIGDYNGPYLQDVTLEIKMKKTGVIINHHMDDLFYIAVSFLDPLTGSISYANVDFAKGTGVNIKKIVFNP